MYVCSTHIIYQVENKKITFQLRPQDEFIELMKLLQLKDIAQSGGHAKVIIQNGEVKVNNQVELRKRKKVKAGEIVCFNNTEIAVIK